MKICILGAGALGSALGASLAEGGSDVTLLSRNVDHVEAIRARGLRLRDDTGDHVVRVGAQTSADAVGPVDLVIVLVKSFHTREAMTQARGLFASGALALSLQNGLGHEDVLAEFIGRERVLVGKTYAGGTLLGPGHVLRGVRGKETILGELDGGITDRVRTIAAEFERAHLAVQVSDNMLGTIWDKLLINVATGALTAITRMPYGPLFESAALEAVGTAAVREAMEIAHAAGVRLSITDPAEAWRKAGAGLPAQFRTSMLQSLDKGSATEIDYVNGAVVERGQRLGIQTPVNATLSACVKGIEAMAGRPQPRPAGVDHVAVRVADLDWHVRFFEAVLDMPVREVDGPRETPRQVWLRGGIQLIAEPGVPDEAIRAQPWIAHIAVRVRGLDAALARARDWPVTALPQGPNWLLTPGGIALELFDC